MILCETMVSFRGIQLSGPELLPLLYIYIPCDYYITPYLNKLPNSLEGIILILNIRVTFYGSSHSCCRSHVFFSIIFLYHFNYIPIDYVPTIFPFDSRNLPKNYSGIVATIPYFLSNVLRYRDSPMMLMEGARCREDLRIYMANYLV